MKNPILNIPVADLVLTPIQRAFCRRQPERVQEVHDLIDDFGYRMLFRSEPYFPFSFPFEVAPNGQVHIKWIQLYALKQRKEIISAPCILVSTKVKLDRYWKLSVYPEQLQQSRSTEMLTTKQRIIAHNTRILHKLPSMTLLLDANGYCLNLDNGWTLGQVLVPAIVIPEKS